MNTKAIRWNIYTTADPTVERIIPKLAVEIGLNESIMLLQIAFWINSSNNLQNGTYWTYQSLRDMHEKAFPYWSVMTIQRTIQNLVEKQYILVGNFNKRKGDKTQWFALNPDKLSSLTSVLVMPSPDVYQNGTPLYQIDTPSQQNDTTLPETPTKTPTIKKIARAKSKTTQGQKQAMIDAWFMAMGYDAFDIGADRYLNARMQSAARMLKWSTPPTCDEIRLYCENRKSDRPDYDFTWLEKDLATTRLKTAQTTVKAKSDEPKTAREMSSYELQIAHHNGVDFEWQ